MKYTFNLQVSDDKREYSEKLIMGAFDNESGGHIAMKLIAYVMFIEQQPNIDQDAGWHFVPDLIARDDAGDIRLWVDCGRVSMKKVDTIAMKVRSNIDFYVFRKTEREMNQFYNAIKEKVKHIQNVKCISFDDGFIDELGQHLDRTNTVEGYFSEDTVALTLNNSLGKHEGYSAIHRIVRKDE